MSEETQPNIKAFDGEFTAHVQFRVIEAYSVDGGPFVVAKAVPIGGFTVEADSPAEVEALTNQQVMLSNVIELIDEETYRRSKRVPIGIQATVIRSDQQEG